MTGNGYTRIPSLQPAWHREVWIVLVLCAPILLFWSTAIPSPFEKLSHYQPFHTLIEIASIILSTMIFAIGWQTCKHSRSKSSAIISCAFLGVAILDTGHLLTHTGMPLHALIPNSSISPAFWLVARLLVALSLILAIFLHISKNQRFPLPRSYLIAILSFSAIASLLILFAPDWIPDIYKAGSRMTPLRTGLEYAFILMHLGAAVLLLLLSGNRMDDSTFDRNLFLAAFSLALSEFCILAHVNTVDWLNQAAHLYKAIGYFFIYRAIFSCSVQIPLDTMQGTQNRLSLEREMAEITLNSIGDAIISTNYDGAILMMNTQAEDLTGWKQKEAIGKPLTDILHIISQLSRKAISDPVRHAIAENRIVSNDPGNQALLISRNNREYSIEFSASPVRNAESFVLGCIVVLHDITEKFQLLEQMSWQAGHDMLTHLPNRTLLSDRISQAIAHAGRQEHLLLVCFMDLDGFKAINDQHGHEVGDKLLVEVARRLINAVRSDDTVSRLGGDEFVLLLSQIRNMDEVDILLSRILSEMSRPYQIDQLILKVSASIGATIYPFDTSDTDTLLRHADQAMYEAKQSGRNRFHLFDASMDQQLQEHHQQLLRLEKAIEHNELVLHYQPKINLKTNTVTGMEALLRWQHPEQGLLPPLDFLHLAEDSNLIIDIGNWVIDQALGQLEIWHQAGHTWNISVNIAARQLQQQDFIGTLQTIISRHPAAPTRLFELEILESSALADMTHVRNIILACQDMGINTSLDDFGSGYSSLAYLRHLPVNTLKIDQSFVRDMLVDDEDCALVDGILQMARVFKREVIAEGMETAAHGALLLKLGCNLAQGNGIGRAMPASKITGWVEQFKPDPRWQNYPAALIGWGRISSETSKVQTELSL